MKRIEKLSDSLAGLLKQYGFSGRISEYRVFGVWDRSVGPVIARHARPVSVRGRKLSLVVDSPAWMQQLSMLKPEIIEKVNSHLGRKTISELTLKLGEVPQAPGDRTGEEARPARLDDAANTRIEGIVRGIPDPAVRESFRRVIEKDFLNKKKGRT